MTTDNNRREAAIKALQDQEMQRQLEANERIAQQKEAARKERMQSETWVTLCARIIKKMQQLSEEFKASGSPLVFVLTPTPPPRVGVAPLTFTLQHSSDTRRPKNATLPFLTNGAGEIFVRTDIFDAAVPAPVKFADASDEWIEEAADAVLISVAEAVDPSIKTVG